ncbi:ACP S-malonyltransferase [Rickettsiaceae bacterium]|nr:ACP S-malonyltransferase [Rickettsiaceae bacterium]
MNRAFIFPGQGSQTLGMGKDFYYSEAVAKEVFRSVDDTLGYSLSDIIFNGEKEELSKTTNTQPALMATSIAILRVMMQKTGKDIDELCSVVAGHSLGEYTALCASGVFTLEDTTKLLKVRATSMQGASPRGQGAMAACIGITSSDLQKLLNKIVTEGVCEIANDNVEGQIVISGHEYNIDRIIPVLKDNSYKAIKLNVSAPFHSSLIKAAEEPMKHALDEVDMLPPSIPVIANVSADITSDPKEIKQNLISQICGSVRWRETMDKMAKMDITHLVEIGSMKVLSNLAKKSPHDFTITSISSMDELSEFLENI